MVQNANDRSDPTRGARIDLRKAEPGMKLVEAVHTREGNMLVEEGAVLTPHLIDLLDLWGIEEILIEVPEEERREEEERRRRRRRKALLSREARELKKRKIYDLGLWIRAEAKNLLTKIEEPRTAVDAERLKKMAASIVEESSREREIMISLTTILDYDTYLFAHSVHVAVLSVVVGITMGLSKRELFSLAYGGLLIDLGMMKVDKNIWLKRAPLTDEEFELIRQHPIYSVREAEKLVPNDRDAMKIVAQHHERMDGSGYPYGLKGRLIHPLARVVAVCDIYDAMQADRSYRKKFLPYQAMSHLLVSSTETLDAEVVRAFLQTMSAYPIGSFVRLDSGEIGVVISSNPQSPIRPVVKIFRTAEGVELEEPFLVELASDARFITGPVDPGDLGIPPHEVF
ncbi:MAG: HD-GYP domain-containing protein [Candidatus Hydrogenedentota bacterium]|nr:MAG: HD-GYP domain-containing protein [Candidatus Hydrogenedentota bacterium]